MRILIDARGADSRSGGTRLYAEQLVTAWVGIAPQDRLIVAGGPWLGAAFAGSDTVTPVVVREGAAARIAGQWLGTALLARRHRVDAVVSLTPVVTPFAGRRPRICVVHDWRHRQRPGEFGRANHLYRRSWTWSVRHADRAVQISAKTDAETARFVPDARRVLVGSGRDHALRWPRVEPDPLAPPTILTFGHQGNKRPELVLRALARLDPGPVLVVLGATGEQAAALRDLADELGVGERVELPGFVPDEDYRARVQRAAVVVLASTDEGFGLPVTEASAFGIPVVTTDDNGLDAIHPGAVRPVPATPADLAGAVANALRDGRAGGPPATVRTWADAAREFRALTAGLVGSA